MLYAGMDVHKRFCQIIVCTKEGEVVKKGRIKTDEKEIREFFYGLKNVKVAIEASANYSYIVDALAKEGYEVLVAHPLRTRAIAEAKIKSDKIDAKILADLARGNLIPTSWIPPKEIRELRDLVRQRIFLVKQRTKIKNKIHAELIKRGIECRGNIFTKAGKEWLHSLKIPAIETYLSIMEKLEEEIKKMDKRLKEEEKKFEEVKLLKSIPGVSTFSALVILAEIGDVNRFPDEKKTFSYAGLVPSVHKSGDRVYYGHITKQGSKYLRWILVECARIHVRKCDSKITEFYRKLRRKGKHENVAIIGAARKLLQTIYYMLKKGESFHS
ncbi:MAG TPA: IS110 family transposase [Thermoplasmatales archaeon]|nr:IS110 family transposase [Thermoplasmatales archaeon]